MSKPPNNLSRFATRLAMRRALLAFVMVGFAGVLGCGDTISSGGSDKRCDSKPRGFFVAGDKLYFGAGVEGAEGTLRLWVIEGDRKPALVDDLAVADVSPETFSSSFAERDDEFYFLGSDADGFGMWRTDGNSSAKLDIAELNGQRPYAGFVKLADSIYFAARSDFVNGEFLHNDFWRLNAGDEISTVAEIPRRESISQIFGFQDRLIFTIVTEHATPREVELWELAPGGLPEKIAQLDATAFQILDGILYFAVDEEIWSYDGVDAPTEETSGGRVTQSILFDGEIYYEWAFAQALAAFNSVDGLRLVDQLDDPEVTLLRIIDIFDDQLLLTGGGELWLLGDAGVIEKVEYEGRTLGAGREYRGNVFFGVGKEQDEELWAFDGARTFEVDAASPGIGCSNLESPD